MTYGKVVQHVRILTNNFEGEVPVLLDDGETKYVFFFLGGGSDISSIESHEISATDSSSSVLSIDTTT